jgi:ribosomal protein S18 acetylase RimI-like enzyme
VAEIKKVHLIAAVRGIGDGRALLSKLEKDALAAGAVRFILETGARNTAALALVRAAMRNTRRDLERIRPDAKITETS